LIITEECLGHCQLSTIHSKMYSNYSASPHGLMKPILVTKGP
jgi:hypothetical protein